MKKLVSLVLVVMFLMAATVPATVGAADCVYAWGEAFGIHAKGGEEYVEVLTLPEDLKALYQATHLVKRVQIQGRNGCAVAKLRVNEDGIAAAVESLGGTNVLWRMKQGVQQTGRFSSVAIYSTK